MSDGVETKQLNVATQKRSPADFLKQVLGIKFIFLHLISHYLRS